MEGAENISRTHRSYFWPCPESQREYGRRRIGGRAGELLIKLSYPVLAKFAQ